MIHYDRIDLVVDNVLTVERDCECGHPRGCSDCCGERAIPEVADLTTLLHNLAVAGALHRAYVEGRVDGIKDGQFLARFE